MAILQDGTDEYEVCIKRHPQKSNFEEYIKIGDREKPDSKERTRFVVGEEGVTYAVEVTLKKGFIFGHYDFVRAKLYLPGQKDAVSSIDLLRPSSAQHNPTTSNITKMIEYADVEVGGQKMLGTRFTFRNLVADENLKNETDVNGVAPNELGFFYIELCKHRRETRTLTEFEYSLAEDKYEKALEGSKLASRQSAPKKEVSTPKLRNLWDAQKVDEDSFSKDGITCAVGFVGGRPRYSTPARLKSWTVGTYNQSMPPKPSRTKVLLFPGSKFKFSFYYRTEEFLDRVGIIKYPPPLHVYAWGKLTQEERKIALKEIQDINKEHVHEALEAKTGGIHVKYGMGRKKDEPKEWRAWGKMYVWERRKAFETLQEAKKTHDRDGVLRGFESNGGEIISLVDDDDDEPKTKTENHSRLKRSSDAEHSLVNSEDCSAAKQEVKIKNEPIDLDKPPSSKASFEDYHEAAPSGNDNVDDGELERKKEKEKALAEEIEAEERLARLRRERRALREEIEAAERKKQKLG